MVKGNCVFPVENLRQLVAECTGQEAGGPRAKAPVREISRLVQTVRLHHDGTFRHSLNVARLSAWLARQVGLSHEEVLAVSLGALLHDFGKTKVSPQILDKPGQLTRDEWETMKRHPLDGVSMLSAYGWAQALLPIVANHHERMDGRGYLGLPGEKIPLGARIVSICDAFDAMITPRPYRCVWTLSRSWSELEKHGGTQFDAELVPPFIQVTARLIKP